MAKQSCAQEKKHLTQKRKRRGKGHELWDESGARMLTTPAAAKKVGETDDALKGRLHVYTQHHSEKKSLCQSTKRLSAHNNFRLGEEGGHPVPKGRPPDKQPTFFFWQVLKGEKWTYTNIPESLEPFPEIGRCQKHIMCLIEILLFFPLYSKSGDTISGGGESQLHLWV